MVFEVLFQSIPIVVLGYKNPFSAKFEFGRIVKDGDPIFVGGDRQGNGFDRTIFRIESQFGECRV